MRPNKALAFNLCLSLGSCAYIEIMGEKWIIITYTKLSQVYWHSVHYTISNILAQCSLYYLKYVSKVFTILYQLYKYSIHYTIPTILTQCSINKHPAPLLQSHS